MHWLLVQRLRSHDLQHCLRGDRAVSVTTAGSSNITGSKARSFAIASIRKRNYFGNGSDGAVTYAVNTNLTSTTDGPPVIMNYASLIVNAGVTLTTSNRCRGLIIYVQGDCTINGTITMTARGAFAAGETRIFSRLLATSSASNTDLTVETVSDPYGFGGAFQINIPSVGGAGGPASTAGTAGVGNQTGGGGGGNQAYSGAAGTSFSGGTGGGGKSYLGTGGSAGSANGGPGGAGVGAGQRGAGGGGSGGGVVVVAYKTAGTWSAGYAITATGGAGGAAGTTAAGSGGGGGGAGNPGGAGGGSGSAGASGTGGMLMIFVGGTLTLGSASVISANGSAGGTGGNNSNNDVTAAAGAAGGAGTIQTYQILGA